MYFTYLERNIDYIIVFFIYKNKSLFSSSWFSVSELTTGANLTVKSSKIVSGLEVSKTHELLQAIGRALENKVDSKNAVEEVLNKGVRKSAKVCFWLSSFKGTCS